eukprot:gene14975-31804_t
MFRRCAGLRGLSFVDNVVRTSSRTSCYPCNRQYHKSDKVQRKSWIPTEDDLLQKMTTQALIHEISLDQLRGVQEVVPWFLKIMPASYFRQVPDDLRKSHLLAVAALRSVKQSDLSLKMETVVNDSLTEITIIKSNPKRGLLLSQLKSLIMPHDYTLSRIRVFSTSDGELALNIFSFEKSTQINQIATTEDAEQLFEYVRDIQSGKYVNNPRVPRYSPLLSMESMRDYISR